MLLSRPQKNLIEILRHFGAVRENQLFQLLKMDYPNLQLEPAIRQLVCGGQIRRDSGYLMLSDGGKIDQKVLCAIDVMLLLETKHIEMIQKGSNPFTLTFFKERSEKLWRYDVCVVKPGTEILIDALLENINHKYRMIVFVLEKREQQKSLTVPCEHCYAWKQDGSYRFYKEIKKEV